MITPKLYLYDSTATDYKGTDYSTHILSGFDYTDDLTEVLDVCNITLVGLPFSTEFEPTTKFILELLEDGVPYETYHLCVADDVVSQPNLSDNQYYDHAITFNEASVVAQGRIVDNCSETFELKKVNLNEESVFNPTETTNAPIEDSNTSEDVCEYKSEGVRILNRKERFVYKRKFRWVFTEEYLQPTDVNYGEATRWKNLQKYIAWQSNSVIKLPIPLIATYFGEKDSADYETNMNLCATLTRVYVSSDDGATWTKMTGLYSAGDNGDIIVKPSKQIPQEYNWKCDWRFKEYYGEEKEGYGMNRVESYSFGSVNEYYKKFTDFDDNIADRWLKIPLSANKQYKVIVQPYITPTPRADLGNHDKIELEYTKHFVGDEEEMYYTKSKATITSRFIISQYSYVITNENQQITFSSTEALSVGKPSIKLDCSTYLAGQNTSVFLKSAPALSAYDLFRDALIKSQQVRKQEGVYIKDTPLAYYLDPSDINILQNTEIIESSFHQKNFWEILLEIGKYIHAIPYIEFGENDRFMVRWRYLGQTEKANDVAQTMSIFNSKSIENYVGAVNSYVTNMIQRGGEVEEYLAPKSESEDYLVYNDVAVIKTSKPIIEISALEIICANDGTGYTEGDTANILDYVFEQSVYELLEVVANIKPNKGLGIYYNLGENVIRGLNYQLPSINVGDGDTEYAIKRIIGTALGITPASNWQYIKINDFIFHIKYKTKESVRSEQSRPDLRKYLINSEYEQFPHHKQFNNQQDISVDSIKMGNQVYGKLIRTGNTDIKTTEWNSAISFIKRAGQLVDIRGNIYYVAKATHKFYQGYVVTEVTYSKDYNQLSEIIGIPSEPRFYEISERNIIDRDININEHLLLGTNYKINILDSSVWHNLNELLFNGAPYPKYALTQLKNDIDNIDSTIGLNSFSKAFIHPLSAYSMRNTLTLRWEMADNFSAGDRVERATGYYKDSGRQTDTEYSKLIPTQYCDMYGRADLMDFAIIDDLDNYSKGKDLVRNFPLCPYRFYPQTPTQNLHDISNNTYFQNINYKTNASSTSKTIAYTTESFKIYKSGGAQDGDIYDSNNTSITNSGAKIQYNSYLIVKDGSNYALFICDDITGYEYTYTRIEVSTSYDFIRSEIDKESIYELVDENRVFAYNDISVYYAQGDGVFGKNNHGLAVAKDNREHLGFNYNIQMLTDSDRFVLSGYMWQQKKDTIKVAVLNQEVNKIINNTIPQTAIMRDSNNNLMIYTITTTEGSTYIRINISSALSGKDLTNAKAIAIITEGQPSVGSNLERYFIMARNVDNLKEDEDPKDADWYVSSIADMREIQ